MGQMKTVTLFCEYGNMKKKGRVIVIKNSMRLVVVVVLISVLIGCSSEGTIKHPYTQEYIIGQGNIRGNVDTQYFLDFGEEFEIGANDDGFAVFKDPEKAWNSFIEICSDGIAVVQKENGFEPLTFDNFQIYKNASIAPYGQSDEVDEQILFICKFLDIYENSFKK